MIKNGSNVRALNQSKYPPPDNLKKKMRKAGEHKR